MPVYTHLQTTGPATLGKYVVFQHHEEYALFGQLLPMDDELGRLRHKDIAHWARQHSGLALPEDPLGGGLYFIRQEQRALLLFGESTDYGAVQPHILEQLLLPIEEQTGLTCTIIRPPPSKGALTSPSASQQQHAQK